MITCRSLAWLLAGYFEEGFPVEHRELVEEHLTGCPDCVAFAGSYRAVIDLGRRLPPHALPPEAAQAIRRLLGEFAPPGLGASPAAPDVQGPHLQRREARSP